MVYENNVRDHKGFTLVELLVVMVIMGMVMISVYGVYTNINRTGNTSEEVVDVQQNLRVAMETLVGDIRMAGFLVPSSTTAITIAPAVIGIDKDNNKLFTDSGENNGAFFELQTNSSSKAYARIVSEAFASSTVTLGVAPGMTDRFATGEKIHVIRPATLVDETSGWADPAITITVDPGADTISMTNAAYVSGTLEPGDMIVRKVANEATPTVIDYWLRPTAGGGSNNYELMRRDGTPAANESVVASNISSLTLTYLLKDGTEVNSVTSNLQNINAVRINISAQTDNTKTGLASYSGVKTRTLQTVVKVHNRGV